MISLSTVADLTVSLCVLYAQGRMIGLARGYAMKVSMPGFVAWILILGALGWMTSGFLLGFSAVVRRVPIHSQTAGMWHGLVFLWCACSTSAYFAWRIFQGAVKPHRFDAGRRRALEATGGALAAVPFGVAGYGIFLERTNVGVREVDLRIADLPPDLDGLRLVQLSDIHLSAYLSEKEFAGFVDAANELRSHVALVTGDLVSLSRDPLDACLRQLARLRTDAGVLGCMGNHEIYAQVEEHASREGARLGVRFLRNQCEELRFGSAKVNFAGVDYQTFRRKDAYLAGAERLVRPGALNVLLSHNPDVFPVAARKGFDITLAGHTHGGQINFEILQQHLNVARFVTPYVYGVYNHERAGASPAALYVTRGIGTVGMPVRVGAPPEVALLRLRRT
ncbi:MAG: metallophosphoesterase [Bryobacteraceae bacterium]